MRSKWLKMHRELRCDTGKIIPRDVMGIVEIVFCSIRERTEMKSIQIILAKEKKITVHLSTK